MTAFRFRLQRVLDFRRMQFQLAEADCHQAEVKLHAIQAQSVALAAAKSETRNSVAQVHNISGRDLAPLTGWYRWTEGEKRRLTNLENGAAQELQKRRAALVEAQRKVRLLEKLHDGRRTQWQSDFDREIEELAADSINSRYASSAFTTLPFTSVNRKRRP
jgi:flagellar export protein FliJ